MNVFLEVYKIFYQIKTNGNEYRLPFNEIQNMQINAKYSEKPQLECTKWKSLKFKVTDSDVQRHLVLNLFDRVPSYGVDQAKKLLMFLFFYLKIQKALFFQFNLVAFSAC